MPGAASAEIIFIAAMMILILILSFSAVFFFFKTYKKEMKQKEARKAETRAAINVPGETKSEIQNQKSQIE